MDISALTQAIQQHAVWVVFVNVLAQQMGLPVPAVPTLLIAGSLAGTSSQSAFMLLAAVAASVMADWLWYLAGRVFGYRVLAGLCKLSINPGSCVTETEARFVRWGVWSLVVAKFIPGFSTVAPPIAGSLRMPLPSFIAAAGLGAALWAGAAITAGWWMRAEVRMLIDALSAHGTRVATVLVIGFAVWLIWKLLLKYRFEQLAAIARITPAELQAALQSTKPPLLLDFRGATHISQTGPIEGATPASLDDLQRALRDWPKHELIVTLCACPEDATAVRAAHRLIKLGYTSARPLHGGYDAWVSHLGLHNE